MILPFPRRFDQFLDDVGRGRLIGIPHPEVDNILATLPRLNFEILDLTEDVGGKALYAKEILHGSAEQSLSAGKRLVTTRHDDNLLL